MKKVNLKSVCKQGKHYFVYLGNGTAHKFNSDRIAKKFLCDTNEYLTHKLYEAHDIYTNVFVHYQNNWCYFKHDKPTVKAELSANDRIASRRLSECLNNFNLIVDRSPYINGNHFIFHHIQNILNSLKEVIRILNWLNDSRSKRKELYAYRSLFDRILKIENDLNNYGQASCVCIFRVPQQINESEEYIPKLAIA